jgi:quercetin dioxygenase-like cupin family protein
VQIEHWDEQRDGILNEANMRAKLEARGYRVSRYVYPPGTFFPEHEHAVDKIDGVLAGRFRMTLQGREVVLEPGDCLAVPRGALHSAEVEGGAPVISLDAVKATV